MLTELRHRDPLLFWIGAAMLLVLVVVTLLSIGDTRLIAGLNPWIKPMKFLISVTIFMWTVAWFMPETAGPRDGAFGVSQIDNRQIVRWTIGPVMIVEIALILLQAARGTTSHFNEQTLFDQVIFGIMAFGVFLSNLATLLLLTMIRRDAPSHRAAYLWGIRLGLTIFLLAGIEGSVMILNNAHTIGAPDGGPGLPFVNWSTRFGDLRVAHFFGMHAMQILPLIGFLTRSRNLVVAASIAWVAPMGGLLAIALQGRPLLAL